MSDRAFERYREMGAEDLYEELKRLAKSGLVHERLDAITAALLNLLSRK